MLLEWNLCFNCLFLTAAKCPPITSVSNGVVRPSECTTGTSYPGQCHIFCDNGYDPVGPSAVVCESNGSFDTDITKIGCKKRKCFCCVYFAVVVVIGGNLFDAQKYSFSSNS